MDQILRQLCTKKAKKKEIQSDVNKFFQKIKLEAKNIFGYIFCLKNVFSIQKAGACSSFMNLKEAKFSLVSMLVTTS